MPEGRDLYEVSREKMRTRHLAYRTGQAYLSWIRHVLGKGAMGVKSPLDRQF